MHTLFAYITPLVVKYRLTVIIFVHVKFFKPRKQQKHYSLKNSLYNLKPIWKSLLRLNRKSHINQSEDAIGKCYFIIVQ